MRRIGRSRLPAIVVSNIRILGVRPADIARRYGATPTHIVNVLNLRTACSPRLRRILRAMLAERKRELRHALESLN